MYSNRNQNGPGVQTLAKQLAQLESNLSKEKAKENYQKVMELYRVKENYNILNANLDFTKILHNICKTLETQLEEESEKNSIKTILFTLDRIIKSLIDQSVYQTVPKFTPKGGIIPDPKSKETEEKSTPYQPIRAQTPHVIYGGIPKYDQNKEKQGENEDIPPPPPQEEEPKLEQSNVDVPTQSQDTTTTKEKNEPKQTVIPTQRNYASIIDRKNPPKQNVSTHSQDNTEKKEEPNTNNQEPASPYGSMQNPDTVLFLQADPHVILGIDIKDLPTITEEDVTTQKVLKMQELERLKEKNSKNLEESFKQAKDKFVDNPVMLSKMEGDFNKNKELLAKSYEDSRQRVLKSYDRLIKLEKRIQYYMELKHPTHTATYQQHSTKGPDTSPRTRTETLLGAPKAKASDLDELLPLDLDKDCTKIKNIGSGEYGDVELYRYKGQVRNGERVFDPNILEFCTQARDAKGHPMYVDKNDNILTQDQLKPGIRFHPYYCIAVKVPKKENQKRLEKEIIAVNKASDDWRNEMAALPKHQQKPCPFNLAHGAKFIKDKKEAIGIICKYEAFKFNVKDKKIDPESYNAEKFLSLLFGPLEGLPSDPNERQIYESLRQNKDMIVMQIVKSLYDSITKMHEFNILHLDIALRNTLITPVFNEDGVAVGVTAKACDYGLARKPEKLGQPLITHAKSGPMPWMNRERFVDLLPPGQTNRQEHVVTRAADLYSHKIVLHEIMAYALQLPDLHRNIVTLPLSKKEQEQKKLPTETPLKDFVVAIRDTPKGKDDDQLGWYKNNVKYILTLPTYSTKTEAPLCTTICNRFDGFIDFALDVNKNAAALDRIYDQYFITTIKDIVTKYEGHKDKAVFLRNVQALVSINIDTTLFTDIQKELLDQCKKLSALSASQLEETDHTALINNICSNAKNDNIVQFKKIELTINDFEKILQNINKEAINYNDLATAAKDMLAKPIKKEDQARIKELRLAYPYYEGIIKQIRTQLNAATFNEGLKDTKDKAFKLLDELEANVKNDLSGIWSEVNKQDAIVYEEDVAQVATDLQKHLEQISELIVRARDMPNVFNRMHLALIHELSSQINYEENALREFKIKKPGLDLSKFITSNLYDIDSLSVKLYMKDTMNTLRDQFGSNKSYKKTWATINSAQRPLPNAIENDPNVKLTNLLLKYMDTMPGVLMAKNFNEYLKNPVNVEKSFNKLRDSFSTLGKDDEFMELYKQLGNPNIKDVIAIAVTYNPSLNDAIIKIANKGDLLKSIAQYFSTNSLSEYRAELSEKNSQSKIKLEKAEVLNAKIVLINKQIIERDILTAKNNVIELITHPYLSKAVLAGTKDKDNFAVKAQKLYEITVIKMTEALIAQDKKLFEAINARELFNYSSTEKEKYPSITSYIDNSTALSMFVADNVVSYRDDNQRMAQIEYWINVADYAINNSELANYNVFYAIIAGLTTSQVNRLFSADDLTPSVKEKFLALTGIMQTNTGSYKAYRDSIAEKKSAIPYFGILSSDSTFARGGNEPTIKALKKQSGKTGAEQLHFSYRENQVLRKYQQQSRAISNDKFKINDQLNNQIKQDDLSLKVEKVKAAITKSLKKMNETAPLNPTNIKAVLYQVFAEFLFPGDPLLGKIEFKNIPESVYGKSKDKIQDVASGKTELINGVPTKVEFTDDEVLNMMNLLRDFGQFEKSLIVKSRSSLPSLPTSTYLNLKRSLPIVTTIDKYETKSHPIPANIEPKKLVILDANDIEFAKILNGLGDYTFASTLTEMEAPKDISYMALSSLPAFENKDLSTVSLITEDLAAQFNEKNKDKNISITKEQIVDYKYYAHQLFRNDEHHLNSIRDLMDEPAISKVAAILYLIKHEPKFFITEESDSPELAIVKKNRNNLAKVFLNELSKEDLNKMAALFFETKDIPKDIKNELDLLYKIYPSRPSDTVLSENLSHSMSSNYYDRIEPKNKNESGEYSGIYGAQTHYMQDGLLQHETLEIHFKQESQVAKSMAEVLAIRCLNKLIKDGAVNKAATPLILATGPHVSKINPLTENGNNIYLGSFYDRDSKGSEPAKHFRDSPQEFIINMEDELSLSKQAETDLTTTQSETLDEMSQYFGVPAFIEFAEYIGMNVREKAKEIDELMHDPELEKKPTKNDERLAQIKNEIVTDMKQFLAHKDLMRRESLAKSSLEIDLSKCFNEKNELTKPDLLKKMIEAEPSYFLKGDYHFRVRQQATTIFNILWQRAYEFGTHKNLENKVIAEVKNLLPDLIAKAQTPDIIERILANKKWRDEVQDISGMYHKYEEILTNYYKEKLVNNPSIAEMVKNEILAEKTLDNRVLILERWIRLMEKARADINEEQGANIAAQIYQGIKAVSLNPSIKTDPSVNPLEDPNNPLKNTFAALSARGKDSLNVMTLRANTEEDVFKKVSIPEVNPFAFASTEPSLRTTKPSKIMQDETITRVLHERTAGDQIKEFGFLLDDINKNIEKVMKQLKQAEKVSQHDIRFPFFRHKIGKAETKTNDVEIKSQKEKKV